MLLKTAKSVADMFDDKGMTFVILQNPANGPDSDGDFAVIIWPAFAAPILINTDSNLDDLTRALAS